MKVERKKGGEEVWSRNKHQQKVGKKPPAAGEPEQRAGEPGGNES